MVVGSRAARPAIISEKNSPMDSTNPAFWKVARMPEAAPRWRAGTAFMIPAVLGAANSPEPMPLASSSTANTQYGKSMGSSVRAAKLAAVSSMPPVANGRAP